ncbi:hypothetical protein EL17_06820 [Anditalea andensis]|uniref:Uncharacterized protein n=1 Tax=Anditalea andensis TaxID=1048983 RepID=A0A074KZT2_9BACT|nr:hypothetical protein EL17_06820 [Anditalea andensis]
MDQFYFQSIIEGKLEIYTYKFIQEDALIWINTVSSLSGNYIESIHPSLSPESFELNVFF